MRFLKKRWHSIPVALVAVLLALVLATGGALAAYGFFTLTVDVEVGEPFAFGVNFVGCEAATDAVGEPLLHGYYSQPSPLACSMALMAGESSNGNPDVSMPEREEMPFLTIGEVPCPRDVCHGYHTFNSMMVKNDAAVPVTVSFAVTGETARVYMVTWEETSVFNLNGYTQEVPADGFIMRGIGVVAEDDAVPGSYSFTVTVNRG